MMYTVKQTSSLWVRNTLVPVYSVVDDIGRIYCNVDTRAEAEAFIPVLEAADKRNADAAKALLS